MDEGFSQKEQNEATNTEISEISIFTKVQSAPKSWKAAPEELIKLRDLIESAGYDVDWSPKKLGINLLTANKIRGMVLKRMLMKLYPFESFWNTTTLAETLQKCLLVCQQLGLENQRIIIWGQCSMNISYEFWMKVLKKVCNLTSTSKNDLLAGKTAKSQVIAALIASRGTDWDKQLARNFGEALGKNRFPTFLKTQSQRLRRLNSAASLRTASTPTLDPVWSSSTTTTMLACELRKENETMVEILKNIESFYVNHCVLEIHKSLELGKQVGELATDFEGYMTTNNRGAFKDVESLINHTDRVIRAIAKLTATYNEFFGEFQKYFRTMGGGDEVGLAAAVAKLVEFSTEQ